MYKPTRDTTVLKSIVVMTILAVLLGFTGILSPLDKLLSVGVSKIQTKSVSDDVVVIGIDDKSLDEIGQWPWDRSLQGELLTKLDSYNPKRIVTDIFYAARTNKESDVALANAIRDLKSEFYLAKDIPKHSRGRIIETPNLQLIAKGQNEASIMSYSSLGLIWELPTYVTEASVTIPSLSVVIAGVKTLPKKRYRPDYSFDPSTIKIVSASDVLNDQVDSGLLANKVLVYAPISSRINDIKKMPGWENQPGVFFQIIGGETLKFSLPIDYGEAPATIGTGLFLLLAAFAIRTKWRGFVAAYVFALAIGSAAIQLSGHYVAIFPAFALIGASSIALSRHDKAMRAAATNTSTGLATLDSMNEQRNVVPKPLAVGCVGNFTSIYKALDEQGKTQLLDALIGRIELVARTEKIHHDLQGNFAWYMTDQSREHISDQLQALTALFASPIKVAGSVVKLRIVIGVDTDGAQQIPIRISAATALANQAKDTGVRWLLNDASVETGRIMKISKEIYGAITNDEMSIALQPQIDLRTNDCVGAEALVRWEHPILGNISPEQIVQVASDQGLIEDLTRWIANRSIVSAQQINAIRRGFKIAINIPPSLLSGNALTNLIMPILQSTQFPPELLTLEITEQTEILTYPNAIEQIQKLQSHGIKISIDDYGTGYANLAKLSNVPFDEIKLDRSFVATVNDNDASYAIVEATIMLAKRLGKKVVAEGIENQAIADALRKMGCDQAQGFLYGKPMNINAFINYLTPTNKHKTALI
jgi:EAL domain-containing protein (putative c-di-GMP-specific phosphodiesterase class I)/CHASE2 domain-containing sensor protein